MTIRVLVADDQEIVRTGLRMILDAQPGIEVVGEAADGRAAVALARQLRPDVCLFDIRMPAMDGIERVRAKVRPRATSGTQIADRRPMRRNTAFSCSDSPARRMRSSVTSGKNADWPVRSTCGRPFGELQSRST